MHGGAITLARRFAESEHKPDLVIATDMLDLTTFLAFTRERLGDARTLLYFHENQITYPWSESDPDPTTQRDIHYGFINFASALAADAVAFNSEYHRTSFLGGLDPFLRIFPDHNETGMVHAIDAKAHVLPLGIDLGRLDGYRVNRPDEQRPLILWNHRWEYDKKPNDFFRALIRLKKEGVAFDVAVLGEKFQYVPVAFEKAALKLADRIVQFGFVEDFATYASWLWKADLLPVTSIHDFFGASVVQAIYCNTYPLLPGRLAYPEHIPDGHHGDHIYEDFDDLVTRLRYRIEDIRQTRQIETQHFVRHYDWQTMAPEYDSFFETICNS
jgi:glycosyltransferase involved in cell wall biosynthesis